MRIFYAADSTPNALFEFDSKLWRCNLYQSLVECGHDVIEFDYDLRETFLHLDSTQRGEKDFIKVNRPKLTAELLGQVRKAHREKPLDLFFSYFYDACVLPEGIEEIKRLGIVTVNWYCNGSFQMHLVSEISPHYDWCLVPEEFRLEYYRRIGANPIYFQEAANPNVYRPCDVPQEFDVTFVGQAYGDRPAFIKHLLEGGIDIKVWGMGWQAFSEENRARKSKKARSLPRAVRKAAVGLLRRVIGKGGMDEIPVFPNSVVGGPLSDADMIRMFSRSKINLGFSSCGNTHRTKRRILQVRLRDFEVPMSGGFYMVEYMEELEKFYDVGKEIICYRGHEDLLEKVRYYLVHENEREAIRRAGYLRCLHDHTWHKRFEHAFRKMGLA